MQNAIEIGKYFLEHAKNGESKNKNIGRHEKQSVNPITGLKKLINFCKIEIELDEYKCTEQDLTGWVERTKECLHIDKLSRDVVVGLIDRIEVSQAYSVDGEINLDISISYKFGRLSQKKRAC